MAYDRKSKNRGGMAGIVMLMVILALVSPRPLRAEADGEPQPGACLPADVKTGLDFLLDMIPHAERSFDRRRVAPLIDWAAGKGIDARQIEPDGRKSGRGTFLQAEIRAPLERILRYGYNPAIPNFVVFPSVLRLSGWYPDSDIMSRGVTLWNEPQRLEEPMILRGREFEVNTPDSFGGAYYRYDMDRLIALMNHRKGRVLISVSKMNRRSEVGKKAVIIDDGNWNYFYSGINGLNLKILGAMDTYMYDSESVLIFYQADIRKPLTTVSLFKWLKAGWAGINVVKPDHIHEGSRRSVQGMKMVMESDSLPDADIFARQVGYIRGLSDARIDSKIREYSLNFEKLAKSHKRMSRQDFAGIIENGGYAGVLNREERESILILECLKHHLGKPALVKLDFFPPADRLLTHGSPAAGPG